MIAVLANMDGNGDWLTGPDAATTVDYPMAADYGRDRHRWRPDRLLSHP